MEQTKKFKRVEPEPLPDKLLPMKNAYKIAAATWIIDMVEKNKKAYTCHLSDAEEEKVFKEMDRILERIRTKRRKDADNG